MKYPKIFFVAKRKKENSKLNNNSINLYISI